MGVEVTDTAAAIARARAWESELPESERLFSDPYARLFAGGPAADEAVALFLTAPNFREQIRIRTRFIDDAVRAAFAAGTRQLIILGVGFDCRALRLREIAARGVKVFEVDFAAQLERKAEVLAAAGTEVPPFVSMIPTDFTAPAYEQRLTTDLEAAGFEAAAPVVVVWEGVVSYLTEEAANRGFRWIAGTGGAGSRLVFNYPISRFDPVDLLPRIRAHGFAWLDDCTLADVYGRYLPGTPPPGCDLYHLAVAWR